MDNKVETRNRNVWAFTGNVSEVSNNDLAYFSGWHYGETEDEAKNSFLAGYDTELSLVLGEDIALSTVSSSMKIPVVNVPVLEGSTVRWRGNSFMYTNEQTREAEAHESDFLMFLVTVFSELEGNKQCALHCVVCETEGLSQEKHDLQAVYEKIKGTVTSIVAADALIDPRSHYEDGWIFKYNNDFIHVPVRYNDIEAIGEQWGENFIYLPLNPLFNIERNQQNSGTDGN